jgi:transcriptional regulator with XRE-family HTH domain
MPPNARRNLIAFVAIASQSDHKRRPSRANVTVDGEALFQARGQKGWTQAELADESTVSKRTIENLERGGKAHFWTVKQLAKALDVGPSSLTKERLHQNQAVSGDLPQTSQKAAPPSQNSLTVIDKLMTKYSGKKMMRAINAVHAAAASRPQKVDGTKLDESRRVLKHFWRRVALFVRDGIHEDRLRRYFKEGVDDWQALEPIERQKLTEMYLRQGLSADQAKEKVDHVMAEDDVQWLYDRWRGLET